MGKSSRRKKQPGKAEITDTGALYEAKGTALPFLRGGILPLLIIAAVGLAAYSNTFGVPFVLDDRLQIELNPMIKSFSNFVLYFKGTDIGSMAGYTFSPSRIVGYLTFALNYAIGRLDVTGYHIFNLAVHISNAVLVYILVNLTFRTPYFNGQGDRQGAMGNGQGDRPDLPLSPIADNLSPSSPAFTIHDSRLIALFAALLFISHPVQTQAVTYIVQRFASLATLFYLLSLVMYIKGRLWATGHGHEEKSTGQVQAFSPLAIRLLPIAFFSLSLISAVCAMKTKEIAFTLPLILILYEFTFFSASLKKRLLLLLPVLMTLAIIALSLSGTNKTLSEFLSDLAQFTRVQTNISRTDYFLTELTVVVTYVRLIFLPVGQNLDYDYPIYRSLFSPPVFLSFLFLAALFGTAVYLLYRSRQGARGKGQETGENSVTSPIASGLSPIACYRLIAFGILWFFITLSVESSFIPIADVIFEHRIYLPSVGAFIAIAAGVDLLALRFKLTGQKTPVILCAVLIVILSAATFMRNNVWRTEVGLWEDVVKKSPNNVRDLHILATAYLNHGLIDKARPLLKELSTRTFDSPDVHEGYYLNLATLDLQDDRPEAAVEALRKAVEINGKSFQAYAGFCEVFLKKQQPKEALEACGRSLDLMPNYPPALNSIASVYRRLGNLEEAMKAVKTAIAVDPEYALPYNNLGLIYVAGNRFNDAMAAFRQALILEPNYTEAYNNLAGVFMAQGNFAAASVELQKALEISPDYSRSHYNLGVARFMSGDREGALKEYEILQKMAPKDAADLLAVMQGSSGK